MHSEQTVDIPIARFAEAFLRCVIVVAVLIGGYIAIEPMLRDDVTLPDEKVAEAFGWEEEEFDEFLKDIEREQLISVLSEWVIDPSIPFEPRTRVILNQIKAAQKIASSPLNQRKFFGVSQELLLRSELAKMGLRQGVFDADQIKALKDLASLYKSVSFDSDSRESIAVNENARMGEIVAETVALVETESPKDDIGLVNELLEKVRNLSDHFVRNSKTGLELTELAELAKQRLDQLGKPKLFSNRFEDLLNDLHSENTSFRIEELAKLDCLEASASQLDYLPSDSTEFKDRFLVQFRRKLDQVLEVESISQSDYVMIMSKLSDIAESGWPRQSAEMLDSVANSFREKDDFPALEDEFLKLKSRLAWVGSKFPLDLFQTVENRAPAFRDSGALATIMIFISLKNHKASDNRFKQLGRVYNTVFRNATIDFVVVFLHEDDQRNGLQNMRRLDNEMPQVDFWHLNVNSPKGKELAQSIEIDETPYVQILDRSRRVTAINPRPKIVVDILNRLNAQD